MQNWSHDADNTDIIPSVRNKLLSNNVEGDSSTAFFTQVPKTGSTVFIDLLRQLQKKKLFTLYNIDRLANRSAVYLTMYRSFHETEQLVNIVSRNRKHSVYYSHVNFVDFKKHGWSWSPKFIGIIRDPIERVIKLYKNQLSSHFPTYNNQTKNVE